MAFKDFNYFLKFVMKSLFARFACYALLKVKNNLLRLIFLLFHTTR
jgi:hypothetical protein